MSQIQDLIERFLSFPKDFAYSELTRLLSHFKYREIPGGKGSHFRFQRHPGEQVIIIPKPHGGSKTINRLYLKQIADKLKRNGDLRE